MSNLEVIVNTVSVVGFLIEKGEIKKGITHTNFATGYIS